MKRLVYGFRLARHPEGWQTGVVSECQHHGSERERPLAEHTPSGSTGCESRPSAQDSHAECSVSGTRINEQPWILRLKPPLGTALRRGHLEGGHIRGETNDLHDGSRSSDLLRGQQAGQLSKDKGLRGMLSFSHAPLLTLSPSTALLCTLAPRTFQQ